VQIALDLLRKQCLIESKPRSGMWRTGETPGSVVASRKANARDLATLLSSQIRDGLHPWGQPLPSIKELAARWNCHPRTASKALDIAMGEGSLARRGRLHFPSVAPPRKATVRPVLLCISYATADGKFRMDSDRESDFWREIGSHAAHAGLSLRRIAYPGELTIPAGTVGVVATTWHQADPARLYGELGRLRLPVCVWVEDPVFDKSSWRGPRMYFHDLGYATGIGASVARHFLDLGHEHIAYISPWHSTRWSRNRLEGVAKEVAGRRARLEAFCSDDEPDDAPLARRDHPPSDQSASALVRDPGSNPRFDLDEFQHDRIRQKSRPLFASALASGATAWICANDDVALRALDWLRENAAEFPKTISVAGFDDSVDALRADLTSYRFASDAMARSMILQILSSNASKAFSHHEGVVVPRSTSA